MLVNSPDQGHSDEQQLKLKIFTRLKLIKLSKMFLAGRALVEFLTAIHTIHTAILSSNSNTPNALRIKPNYT